MEGGGFPVRRPPVDNVGKLILLFDHMGPMVIPPGGDFPGHDHPHRGFETVSYHIQGTLEHHCSSGATGRMGPGCAQWMTAGRGVVHGGNVPGDLKAAGQTVEAFQIWVNLPAAKKMVPPRYQDVSAESLPVARVPHPGGGGAERDSTVKVLAGAYGGTISARIDTHSPITLLDIRLQPGAVVHIPVPRAHVGLVYAYRGYARVGAGGAVVREGYAGMIGVGEGEGEELTLSADDDAPLVDVPAPHKRPLNGTEPASAGLLLVFGAPIDEPVARHGPFVMNTEAELQQAFADFRSGKMGQESRVKHEGEL